LFLQPDTLIPNVYDPQSLNRYSFERNNPYKNMDETGHETGGEELPSAIFDTIEMINLKKVAREYRTLIEETENREVAQYLLQQWGKANRALEAKLADEPTEIIAQLIEGLNAVPSSDGFTHAGFAMQDGTEHFTSDFPRTAELERDRKLITGELSLSDITPVFYEKAGFLKSIFTGSTFQSTNKSPITHMANGHLFTADHMNRMRKGETLRGKTTSSFMMDGEIVTIKVVK
jgi:hypothetical protein